MQKKSEEAKTDEALPGAVEKKEFDSAVALTGTKSADDLTSGICHRIQKDTGPCNRIQKVLVNVVYPNMKLISNSYGTPYQKWKKTLHGEETDSNKASTNLMEKLVVTPRKSEIQEKQVEEETEPDSDTEAVSEVKAKSTYIEAGHNNETLYVNRTFKTVPLICYQLFYNCKHATLFCKHATLRISCGMLFDDVEINCTANGCRPEA